jgi:uncharacterized membrane protein
MLAPFSSSASADPEFRWRGGEVTRLEALSDGVFAITISLLVITLEVPANFSALSELIAQLPVFLACFLILMAAWRAHFLFFRRFGLHDGTTQALNAIFLFLILFFAFPLKFMAMFLWSVITGADTTAMFVVPDGSLTADDPMTQRAEMLIYLGLGVMGLFGALAALSTRAWAARVELQLNAVERAMTLSSLIRLLIPVAVALISLIVVWSGAQPGVAGICYFMLMPLLVAHAFWARKRIIRARS